MDIRKFAVQETGVIELRGPDDELMLGEDKKPMTITVYGPGSKQFAKAQSVQNNRVLDRLKRKGKTDQTPEEKAREQAELLASCTAEFSPNIELEGLKGEALYKAVYADSSLGFIADQVAKFIGDWSNFTNGSTKN